MNSKHLGDALDHWKGSIIQRLQDKGLVEAVNVIPMITHDKQWRDEIVSAYSKLLHLNSDDSVLKRERFEHTDRDNYFKDIHYCGDLFVDPDTGVSIDNSERDKYKYITLQNIKQLLDHGEEHHPVIMVYQHRSHEKEWLKLKAEKIEEAIRKQMKDSMALVAYDFGTVAMLFFSCNKDKDRIRIKAIETNLETMLPDDPMIKTRIYPK